MALNIKFPKFDFKFPKLKMDNIEDIEELKVDYDKIEKEKDKKLKKGEHYTPTSYKNIREVYDHSMENYGKEVFLLDKDNPKDEEYKKWTFREFGDDVEALGTALISKYNVGGEPIAIMGENQYGWYISYMACLLGTGLAVPVDKELPENEIENVINRSKATVLIYSPKKKDELSHIKDNLTTVKYFIQMKSDDPLEGRDVGLNTIIKEGKELVKKDNTLLKQETDPEHIAGLFFTSGTTSNAKGVMLNYRNLTENINAVSAYVRLNIEDRLFSVLPLHHTYESSIGFLLPFATGSSIAVCQGLRYISQNIKESEPTAVIAVPLLIENIYKNIEKSIKKSGKEATVLSMMHITNALKNVGIDIKRKVFKEIYAGLGGRLRIIVTAAAPMDKKIGKWFQDLGILFLQGYGLTETAPISAVTPEFDPRVGSAGKTIICAKTRVDSPNENGEGEILINSSTLMMGYYEDEEATKEVIERDEHGERWFHSGDIGYIDKDGYIYITGRIKNVIVTQNGKNVFPEEIELMIDKIPEVKESMVYGKEIEGEKELIVTARVIMDEDEIKKIHGDISDQEAFDIIWEQIKEINKKLTSYKAVKGLEIKEGDFVKTTTMKIKRFVEIKEGKIREDLKNK